MSGLEGSALLAAELHLVRPDMKSFIRLATLAALAAGAAMAGQITSIFQPLATPADQVYSLSVLVLSICAGVFLIVGGLMLYAIVRFRGGGKDHATEPAQVYGSNQIELAWTVIPILIVVVLTIATARITSAVQDHAIPKDALHVTVIGHQYWWEFQYPDLGIVTANELHVPVNSKDKPRTTSLTLKTADVTHSFWVPELAGKTDLLPAQTNSMWFDPRQPGVYLGNCAEYCGTQHAKMQLRVVVDTAEDFEHWVAHQQEPAATEASAVPFLTSACIACHTVQGTAARGKLGPDLTHLMSRPQLAAYDLPNTPQNLRAWIENPEVFKSSSRMPAAHLPGQKLDGIAAYLSTLK